MEPIYRAEFEIEGIHADSSCRMKPSTLLYLIQEVAGRHSTEMALSWEALAKRDLFWAVTRNHTQITRLPTIGEKITVETWPMPTTRVAYPRSVIAYGQDGKECFRSVSLWVLMDRSTRGMVLPGKSGVAVNGLIRGDELKTPSSLIPRPLANATTRHVHYSLLDRNLHMNNTRYLDWVSDLLPLEFHQRHTPREFTVCYLSEAREGQDILLRWDLDPEGALQVDAYRQEEDAPGESHRVFSARVVYGD